MEDPNIDPSPAELALIEAELPEWERLAVRDYWDAVVGEELAAATNSVESRYFRDVNAGQMERGRIRRQRGSAVLRLVTDVPATAGSSSESGELAA